MKLMEYKNEAALDVLADLIEPLGEIATDTELIQSMAAAYKEKKSIMGFIKPMIKGHKKSIIEILAILDGKDPETYEISVLTLPAKLLELLNDPDFMSLFSLQGQMTDVT